MKKLLKFLLTLIIIGGVIAGAFYYVGNKYHDEIYLYYRDNILKVKENIKLDKNEYYKKQNYSYVKNTNDFVAKDKKRLLNIFYTVINSGTTNFTFFCDEKYEKCISDVESLVENKDTLSHINNFVHPYNSFENIGVSYDNYGEIHVKVEKVYSQADIEKLNNKIDTIIKNKIKSNMTTKQKIETIHDYIINNSRYAKDSLRKKNPNKSYSKADDVLIDGYGLCGAYSDAMALFLYKFKVDNYKIASDIHVWNLVKVNNKWLHLDLTWDDPITQDGSDKLQKLFMLIDNKELKNLKVEKHNYNKVIYKEAA